ncbi:hypothetical protein, partial [Aliivibrio fischeri]|uniref:hypothetical protein n=1 Tax=Aliivibrio fischeri TaxID=668 RepID=UPI0020B3B796
MNDLEINRFKVLQDVIDKRLKQVNVAKLLNLSTRQIRQLSPVLLFFVYRYSTKNQIVPYLTSVMIRILELLTMLVF